MITQAESRTTRIDEAHNAEIQEAHPQNQHEGELPDNVDTQVFVMVNHDEDFRPTSPSCLPVRTYAMKREHAERMAIMLNRDLLADEARNATWYVVAYRKGFHVQRVHVPHSWEPSNEYATPPHAFGPDTNSNCRRELKEFNLRQIEDSEGRMVTKWAINIKPLRNPDEQKPETPISQKPFDEVVEFLRDQPDMSFEIVDGEPHKRIQFDSVGIYEAGYLSPAESITNTLRGLSIELARVCDLIDVDSGKLKGISLTRNEPVSFGLQDYDVDLQVWNTQDEDTARLKAERFLSALKSQEVCIS